MSTLVVESEPKPGALLEVGRPEPRRLHIGGRTRVAGWEVLDAAPRAEVDHVGDAGDLARFDDGAFTELYASHVLEHFDYVNGLERVLSEWLRVLKPGGRLYVSVPDLATCCRLFVDDRSGTRDRLQVMQIIYGGHIDKHDYHLTGFDEAFLDTWLTLVGFVDVRRVEDFGLFDDTSRLMVSGTRISLNVVATKPESEARSSGRRSPPGESSVTGQPAAGDDDQADGEQVAFRLGGAVR